MIYFPLDFRSGKTVDRDEMGGCQKLGGGGPDHKGTRENFGRVTEQFYIMIVMVITWL